MSKKTGKIYKLADKRIVLVYDEQPLLYKSSIVLNLLGNDLLPLLDDKGNKRILVKNENIYKEMMEKAELVGFIN